MHWLQLMVVVEWPGWMWPPACTPITGECGRWSLKITPQTVVTVTWPPSTPTNGNGQRDPQHPNLWWIHDTIAPKPMVVGQDGHLCSPSNCQYSWLTPPSPCSRGDCWKRLPNGAGLKLTISALQLYCGEWFMTPPPPSRPHPQPPMVVDQDKTL